MKTALVSLWEDFIFKMIDTHKIPLTAIGGYAIAVAAVAAKLQDMSDTAFLQVAAHASKVAPSTRLYKLMKAWSSQKAADA